MPLPWAFFSLYILIMQWMFINLFVVTLIFNFMKCFVLSKMDLQVEHAQHFKSIWTKATTDPNGPFAGQPFTEGPEYESIDVRMLEELVPMLLPPTETRDALLFDEWSPGDLMKNLNPKNMAEMGVDVVMSPQELLAKSRELGKVGGKLAYFGRDMVLMHLTTMDTVTSPLGLLVPHRVKSATELAVPFTTGTIAHVDGALVEIIDAHYQTEAVRLAALDNIKIVPESVTVKYIESEEMPMEAVLSEEDANGLRMHVPAVEHFNGFVDGQACEITWVSNDRQRVRVRFDNHQVRKRHASTWIDRASFASFGGSPRSPTSGRKDELHAETFYTPEEKDEREKAIVKVQAVTRGNMTRQRMASVTEKTKEIERKKSQQIRLLAAKKRNMDDNRENQKFGKEGLIETVSADRVKKVTMKGDEAWMNR